MAGRGFLLCVALLVAAPAAVMGQTGDGPPRVAVGAGAGIALPLHADFDFTPWAWEADVRVAGSRRILFEAAAGEWRHTRTREATDLPFGSIPGAIGRLTEVTTRVQRMIQVNVLATGTSGRLRVSGGGGIGLVQHRRRTRQTLEGCAPQVPCSPFESTFDNAAGTAQAVGGVEFAVSRAVALYGQARFIAHTRDIAGSETRVTAGVRAGFGGRAASPSPQRRSSRAAAWPGRAGRRGNDGGRKRSISSSVRPVSAVARRACRALARRTVDQGACSTIACGSSIS